MVLNHFLFFIDKIINIAMSPKLLSPTVTDLNTVNMYNMKMKKYRVVLYDFLVTVKAAPHECVIRTGQP